MENLSEIQIDQLEYCIVEEDVKLPTSRVRVSIPKLTLDTSSGRTYPDTTILINDSACKPKSLGPVIMTSGIVLKTFSNLESSGSVDKVLISEEPIAYNYYLRKGTRMIACFMNKNINDGYLTNYI